MVLDDNWLIRRSECRRAPWLSGNLSQRTTLQLAVKYGVPSMFWAKALLKSACGEAPKTIPHFGALRALLLTLPRPWLSRKRSKNIIISRIMSLTRLKPPRSRTVYYGIEESPVIEGSLIPPASDSIHIAYVGCLVAERGPALLLEAAPALSLQTRRPT